MERKFKSNQNITYSCKYHVVWCPKYRRKVFIHGVDERLKQIILEVANEFKAEIIEIEVMPDHVHLLVEVDPQFGVAKLVRYMKGRSGAIAQTRISLVEKSITDTLDELILCGNGWRCATKHR